MPLKDKEKRERMSLDYRLIGFIGSLLLIISEFLPWFSNTFSLVDIFILYSIIKFERAFLYLYPFVSGIICLIGSLLIMYDIEYRINSVIISFIGLGFLTIFLFEIIPAEVNYLPHIQIGFYVCISGFIAIIFGIIMSLMIKE
ncbi:MAG: hypothetical protein EU539_02010 [Promethearchaeota archaeon]|nr:MAG: hypothetical protein EU539_02010 [Candidatus Lokiarchaeota archaeon]